MILKIFVIIIFFISSSVFSQAKKITQNEVSDPKQNTTEEVDLRVKKQFYFPPNSIVQTGFAFSVAGGNSGHTSSSGGDSSDKWIVPFLNDLFRSLPTNYNIITHSGDVPKDNFTGTNFEPNSTFYNQPSNILTPMSRSTISYTSKTGEYGFQIINRSKFYSGEYSTGLNIPFQYNPGTFKHIYKETQYIVFKNAGLNKYFVVQPALAIREFNEEYYRNSDPITIPKILDRMSEIKEITRAYSMQSGLSFLTKFSDFRFRLTTKLFQPLPGVNRLTYSRSDYSFNGVRNVYSNINYRTNEVNYAGYELEGEINYSISKINIFLGYTLTEYFKTVSLNDKIPILTSTENYNAEIFKFALINSQREGNFLGFGESNLDKLARTNTIKHFYFGLGVNF